MGDNLHILFTKYGWFHKEIKKLDEQVINFKGVNEAMKALRKLKVMLKRAPKLADFENYDKIKSEYEILPLSNNSHALTKTENDDSQLDLKNSKK